MGARFAPLKPSAWRQLSQSAQGTLSSAFHKVVLHLFSPLNKAIISNERKLMNEAQNNKSSSAYWSNKREGLRIRCKGVALIPLRRKCPYSSCPCLELSEFHSKSSVGGRQWCSEARRCWLESQTNHNWRKCGHYRYFVSYRHSILCSHSHFLLNQFRSKSS